MNRKNIIISSLDEKSGKTTVALAIAKLSNMKVGYMKPIGDNPIYKEKRVEDYDAIIFKEIFKIENEACEMCLGLRHSKILHFYEDIEKEFMDRYNRLSTEKELFIIEGGEYLWRGCSLKLDAISISKKINADIIFVVSGDFFEMVDEIDYLSKQNLQIKGIILNRVEEEEAEKMKTEIENRGLRFLGYLPIIEELKAMKVRYIAEKLFANIVAGEKGLDKYVKNIFIAALSASEIKRHPDFKKENKLIITGGDRADVITACIEDGTSGIILTNNIVPSANILAKANEKEIPLLSVRPDTYTVAKLVENILPTILPEEENKIKEIVRKARINIEEIVSS